MKGRLLLVVFMVMVFAVVSVSHGAEVVRVAGSGGMIPLITELAKAYMAGNKNVTVEVNQKSIQSAGGILSAAEGKIEIGMANRPFRDEEKNLGLQAIEIARVGVVVGVNRSVPVKEISSEDLCNIYAGKIRNWKDLGAGKEPVLALTKSEKDAVKETVRKSIACFRDLKEAESVLLVPTSPETAKVLSNRVNTIGFTDSVDVAGSGGAIVALKLDGVAPTAENIKSGKYRLVQGYRLVTKGNPGGAAKDFIDFVKGPGGTKIIESYKAVAVR